MTKTFAQRWHEVFLTSDRKKLYPFHTSHRKSKDLFNHHVAEELKRDHGINLVRIPDGEIVHYYFEKRDHMTKALKEFRS